MILGRDVAALLVEALRILLLPPGIGQGVQQVQVLGGGLQQLSRGRHGFDDGLPRPLGDGAGDGAVLVADDADVVLVAADGMVVVLPIGIVGGGRAAAADGPKEALVPLAIDLHGDHGPAKTELDGLLRRQLDGPAEVQVRSVGRAGVGEDELPVLEADGGMAGRHGAVVQDHVGSGRPAEEEGTGAVLAVGLHEGGERQLEAGVEQSLGHLVLGGHEEGDVGRLEAGLEQLHGPAVLEAEVGLEGRLADGAGGVDRRQEADLVVGLGGVPLAEAADVDVARVAAALARGDEGILLGILVVEAHVARRGVAEHAPLSGPGAGFAGWTVHVGIVRVFILGLTKV
mmetsp:Transcript_15044/g.43465  ORF Transcript_15044/g.43465 Transcript_15044/m.43465 type:complete len:343 (-) Transcript_15044:1618-2646(-)